MKKMWCIPPKQSAEFAARMEDILEVYSRPFDENRPVVCMDEKPFQLLDEYLEPIPMSKTNHIEKYDCEYVRKGSCSIFLFTEPLGQWREAHALPQRTSVDWAKQIQWLADEQYPLAEKIVLVMDNLNTHDISSLYKAFPPEEAYRLAQRFEIHYTPKHGSWLDIAEIGINIMTRECLNRRIPNISTLREELKAWNEDYNSDPTTINWQFCNETSRVKLKNLYPNIERNKAQRDLLREKKSQIK